MKKAMKRMALFVISTMVLLSLTKCSEEDSSSGAPAPDKPGAHEVWMQNTSFVPATLTISQGTSVTWTNKENMNHTTTSDDGLWDSGTMGKGDTFSHTFDHTGSFNYHCTIHASVMTGKIVVVEPSQGTPGY